jgi:hypothetical protein
MPALATQALHAYMVGIMHEWVLDPAAYDLAGRRARLHRHLHRRTRREAAARRDEEVLRPRVGSPRCARFPPHVNLERQHDNDSQGRRHRRRHQGNGIAQPVPPSGVPVVMLDIDQRAVRSRRRRDRAAVSTAS